MNKSVSTFLYYSLLTNGVLSKKGIPSFVYTSLKRENKSYQSYKGCNIKESRKEKM